MIASRSAFSQAQNTIVTRKPPMTLHDVYVGSQEAKATLAEDHIQKIIAIYDGAQKGERSPFLAAATNTSLRTKQEAAINLLVSTVEEEVEKQAIDREKNPEAFKQVVRRAYGKTIATYGTERVNPAERGGVAKYNEWFKVYVKSFPIGGERETKSDMRDLLATPMTKKGYGEIAIGLRDPLTGLYAGGTNSLMVAEAVSGMFTYAFIDAPFQGLGLGRALVAATKQAVTDTVKQYNPKDTRKPLLFLEKNKLQDMPLENILLDTTGVDIQKSLPRQGEDLSRGAISQAVRDSKWGGLGAKELKNVGYIQPSLDGVTVIKDPAKRALAIRYLQEDHSLNEDEKQCAALSIKAALGKKAEHCPLALCTFVDKSEDRVDAHQAEQFLRSFYQTSVLDTNKAGLERDIFSQATLGKLSQQVTADGTIPLIEVKPYAGPIHVTNFKEAEMVTRALFKVIPEKDLRTQARRAAQGLPTMPYSAWLDKHQGAIRAELNMVPKANPGLRASGPRQ